ncbi:MAG: O-antigen ligase family protein [Nitrospirae bacterium]|nr:O-antigen ligase family protein [Nitrospirota bacterium]
MGKQELFLITLTVCTWLWSFKDPIYGLSYFYLYFVLEYNYLYVELRSIRPLFVTPLFALASLMLSAKKRLVLAPQFKMMVAFFIWMCLSRMVNGYEVWEGEYIDHYFKGLFFFLLLTNAVDTREKLVFILWIMVIAYADLAYVSKYYGRLAPYFFLDKNNYAFSLVGALIYPVVFSTDDDADWLRKLEGMGYFLLLLYGIAGSNSRGGYVGVIGIFVAMLIFRLVNFKKLLWIILPVAIALANVSSVHWERFGTISADKEQGGTGGQRLALWSSAGRMVYGNPVFGVGSGESPNLFNQYSTFAEQLKVGGKDIGQEIIKVHNMILQIASETGLVGISLFILIALRTFRDVIATRKICGKSSGMMSIRRIADGVGIAFIGLMFAGQFSNFGYDIQLYTTSCLAYCVKSIAIREQEGGAETQKTFVETLTTKRWGVYARGMIFLVFTYMSLRV